MSRFLDKRFSYLVPYTPGEQPKDKQYIKLNTNESPFPPSPKVIEALNREETAKLMLYPDPTADSLISAIAAQYGLKKDRITAGNGSDEILAFAFMAFCSKDIPAAFADITYGFYKVYADLMGIPSQIIPLRDDLSIAVEDYYSDIDVSESGGGDTAIGIGNDTGTEGAGMNRCVRRTIFIANPNAPTGLSLSRRQIQSILEHNRDNLVVLDEAYVDFGGESCVPLIEEYPNLLIVQTFSKSRNLAGARIGFAMGQEPLIEDLQKMKYSFNPYNINRLSIIAGTKAMEDREYFIKCTGSVMETREWTKQQLQELGFFVTDSRANFLFAEHKNVGGRYIYEELKKRGVLVRYFDVDRIRNFVRISIGTRDQMEILIDKLKDIMGS